MVSQIATVEDLLTHAQAYYARGWTVIPTTGKRAACAWRPYQRSRPGREGLEDLFAKKSIDGLAVILGSASGGLACQDFDQVDAYDRWAEHYPDLAAVLPTVKTARGFHVYSQATEERFIRLADGEYRADSGHYVLLPPSRHPDGCHYAWVVPLPEGPLPEVAAGVFVGQTTAAQPTLVMPTPTGAVIQAPQQPQDTQSIPTLHVSDGNLAKLLIGTLPTGPGQRNKQLFELARGLMTIPSFDTSPKNLRVIVKEWWSMALPNMRTKDFDTTWTDFVIAWRRAKFPKGATFQGAVAEAKAIATPDAGLIYENPDNRLAVALFAVLQAKWGNKPFPLSCRKLAEAVACGRDKAWRILQTLKADEIVYEVSKGTQDRRRASEWRYVGDQK